MPRSTTRPCLKCDAEVYADSRVCIFCGNRLWDLKELFKLAASQDAKALDIHLGRHPRTLPCPLPAGTRVAERYRVLGPIGSGVKGEVYGAYDFILNQAVALEVSRESPHEPKSKNIN